MGGVTEPGAVEGDEKFWFLVCPARPSHAQRAMLERRTYAHRGLYAADQRVPENSLPAFRAAVEAG